jgi:hypothetical protein
MQVEERKRRLNGEDAALKLHYGQLAQKLTVRTRVTG